MLALKKLTVAVVLCSPLYVSAKPLYVPTDDSIGTRLCVSAAMDIPIRFHRLQQHSGLTLSYIAKELRCNGESIGDFAYEAGNTYVAKRLNRHNPKATYTEIKDIAKQKDADKEKIIHVSGS